jgi:hypothetical protein
MTPGRQRQQPVLRLFLHHVPKDLERAEGTGFAVKEKYRSCRWPEMCDSSLTTVYGTWTLGGDVAGEYLAD